MLGSVKSKEPWTWTAFGKHPSARDFFMVGSETPLVNAFSGWIQSGYEDLISRHGRCPEFYSYRLWAKGIKKHHVLIGLLKGSSDRIGRCYPLMVAGSGELKGWEKEWDLMPFACESLWTRLEYLSSRSWKDVEDLREEIQGLSPPIPQWADLESEREQLKARRIWEPDIGSPSPELRRMVEKARNMANQEGIFFSLEHGYFDDHFSRVGFWHQAFRKNGKGTPNAIFVGGVSGIAGMAVFRRPLIAGDFVRLCVEPGQAARGF